MAFFLRRFSVAQDRDGNPRCTVWMRKVAFAGLPIFGLALSFAAFDWLMGLNYHWFSTMWGPLICRGRRQLNVLLVLVVTALRQAGYLKVVTLEHYHIMGKWMLAFSVFWAYIGFSQYMLYWYANIPEETQYYLVRNTESWWPLSLLLVVGRFFGPFAILLLQGIKKRPHQLYIVAGWIMLMQALDMQLIVLPSLHGTGVHLSIWDFLCPIAIGCSLAFLYLRLIGKNVHFSGARSATDRVTAFEELTWTFPLHRKHQNARQFLFPSVARHRFAFSIFRNFRSGAGSNCASRQYLRGQTSRSALEKVKRCAQCRDPGIELLCLGR